MPMEGARHDSLDRKERRPFGSGRAFRWRFRDEAEAVTLRGHSEPTAEPPATESGRPGEQDSGDSADIWVCTRTRCAQRR
jgi:hypothetical protein